MPITGQFLRHSAKKIFRLASLFSVVTSCRQCLRANASLLVDITLLSIAVISLQHVLWLSSQMCLNQLFCSEHTPLSPISSPVFGSTRCIGLLLETSSASHTLEIKSLLLCPVGGWTCFWIARNGTSHILGLIHTTSKVSTLTGSGGALRRYVHRTVSIVLGEITVNPWWVQPLMLGWMKSPSPFFCMKVCKAWACLRDSLQEHVSLILGYLQNRTLHMHVKCSGTSTSLNCGF